MKDRILTTLWSSSGLCLSLHTHVLLLALLHVTHTVISGHSSSTSGLFPRCSMRSPTPLPRRAPALPSGLIVLLVLFHSCGACARLFPWRAGHPPGAHRGSSFCRSPLLPQSPVWGQRRADTKSNILNPFRGKEGDLIPVLQMPPYAVP